MLLTILLISFAIGCLAGAIRYVRERKRLEKEVTERLILEAALIEAGSETVTALCTTLGFQKAYEMIITNYKINHGIHLKD